MSPWIRYPIIITVAVSAAVVGAVALPFMWLYDRARGSQKGAGHDHG